jgi:hypothetical protein
MALIHVSKDPTEHTAISLGYTPLSRTKVKTLFTLKPHARFQQEESGVQLIGLLMETCRFRIDGSISAIDNKTIFEGGNLG